MVSRRIATMSDWAMAPAWLTVDEAVFLTGYTADQVQGLIDAGHVEVEQAHGRWLIDKLSLRELRDTLFEVYGDA